MSSMKGQSSQSCPITSQRRSTTSVGKSCGRRVVRVTQEGSQIDIRDDAPGSASRGAIADLFTPWLVRQSVVNVAEEGPLCIPVATGKKDHSVRAED
jgi:hypothetical protein